MIFYNSLKKITNAVKSQSISVRTAMYTRSVKGITKLVFTLSGTPQCAF